jgi:hypothetical protein
MRGLIFLTVLLVISGTALAAPGPICACNRSHRPVCGNDNLDYPNEDCMVKCG